MAQTVQILRTTASVPVPPLLPGAFSAELGTQTKLWIGSQGGNRLLLSTDPADITVASGAVIAATPPVAHPGTLWWDSTVGQLFVRYFDGNSTAWVVANSLPPHVLVSDNPPAATPGELWWNSTDGQLYIRYQDASSSQWIIANTINGGLYLPISGGALTGQLLLHADPVAALAAATKQYVDNAFTALAAKVAALEAAMPKTGAVDGA